MIDLNLMNGKAIMVNVDRIQAVITGGSGDGSQLVLGGTLTYEVRQSIDEIKGMIAALNA